MAVALYRRYRPDTFQDLIGQEQVTAPLMTALDNNRVNHAYLFSGPRGCGKTTSARILARCLNCAEGPTSTPCGKCESCVELATGGPGSLDVIEIDAASHNGVDDARELRERAIFAPARDRYKIFVLDEAHMITAAGFNALLKVVEEPPEHVKFIFATTEPERVIGTIRSRTHHYPFRLVPPATLLPYLEKILESERLNAEPGVLPLAIRAGGGSVRDTLSVLDQLIAGSEGNTIAYQRTVSLLGYTSTELLTRCIDAISALDSNTLFQTLEQILQAGLDPRRFAEDLLGRLRDLILVKATGESADTVLHGTPADELGILHEQSAKFGMAQLTHSAAIVNHALNSMTGASNPRVQLEMMAARLVLPQIDSSELGALARLEKMEHRLDIDVPKPASIPERTVTAKVQPKVASEARQTAHASHSGAESHSSAEPHGAAESKPATENKPATESKPEAVPNAASTQDATAAKSAPEASADISAEQSAQPASAAEPSRSAVSSHSAEPAHSAEPSQPAESAHAAEHDETPQPAKPAEPKQVAEPAQPAPAQDAPVAPKTAEKPASAKQPEPTKQPGPATPTAATEQPGPVSLQQMRDAWPQILAKVEAESPAAWAQVSSIGIRSFADNILTLVFPSRTNADAFRNPKSQHKAPAVLRAAIDSVLGINVKYLAKVDPKSAPGSADHGQPTTQPAPSQSMVKQSAAKQPPAQQHASEPPLEDREPPFDPMDDSDEVPGWEPAPEKTTAEVEAHAEKAEQQQRPHTAQYGEAVLRERLGAVPIDDEHRRH